MRVVASIRAGELPDDLVGAARSFTSDRKIMRLLDRVSLAPFVACLEVLRRAPKIDRSRLALFTFSGWDASTTIPITFSLAGLDTSSGNREDLVRRLCDASNPTEWLRHLANNTICQAAIAAGCTGPTYHVVGDGSSLETLFALAMETLRGDAVDTCVIVGFDADLYPSGDAAAIAAGLVLAGPADADADALADVDWARFTGSSAVDALEQCITLMMSRATPAGASTLVGR